VSNRNEKGIALITALLVLLLVSSIIVGMCWMVMSDQRLGGSNSDHQTAFYAAEAGMEKMTADLGTQYGATNALSSTDVTTVTSKPPSIPGISFNDASGNNKYAITYTSDANGNPVAYNEIIAAPSPYAGLEGLITPFTLTVQARTILGSESKLVRTVQTVGIPVFQFGIFSQNDLSYFPGPVFNFGGRIHTNGNLWLASGNTLTLADKVTSVGEVILTNLSNGYPTYWNGSNNQTQTSDCGTGFSSNLPSNPNNSYPGAIMAPQIPESQCLQLTKGSVLGTSVVGNISGTLNPNWVSTSTGSGSTQFNSNILGGSKENVPALTLSVAAPGVGGTPIELIRRPVAGENSQLTAERYYTLSSLNILLDDTSALLTNTPNACGAPVDLTTLAVDTSATPSPKGPNQTYPAWFTGGPEGKLPLPSSGAQGASYSNVDGYWIKAHYPIITGYILINMHNQAGGCVDVTKEILNLGLIGRNLNSLSKAQAQALGPKVVGTLTGLGLVSNNTDVPLGASVCADPSANAVIRLARVSDNPSTAPNGGCGVTAGLSGTDIWPNVLYDTREGVSRDSAPTIQGVLSPNGMLTAAGVMNYVELDANNLSRWLTGKIGASGGAANNTTGYTVYFSDRRGEIVDPTLNRKSGAYGFNDMVNPGDATWGCPNGTMDTGEDLDGTGNLARYGGVAAAVLPLQDNSSTGIGFGGTKLTPGTAILSNNSDGTCSALNENWPGMEYNQGVEARENPPLFFRRAIKLVNGGTISLGTCNTVPCGLTVASENPAYVQGDYNAKANGNFDNTTSVAASLVADSTTFLSNSWNDANSFWFPYTPGDRSGNTTTYRLAIVTGKGLEFPQVANSPQDYGTDGGVHNFLRYLEGWNGTLYYLGSLVSFYYNQQAVGPFKCCTTVYGPPTRNYDFDTNFLQPLLLPPRTPMLRDVNTIGFTEVISPTQ
jgi:hypothetical protein